MDTDIAILQLS